MKTLQDQYKLILEGKGNKDFFLKQAKRLFPNYFNQYTDYNSAIKTLKGKRILTEETQEIPEFDPLKDMPNLYNFKDQKKIDNINFNEILKGFYCEMGDIDNLSKTVDELIKIVTDNLIKDPLYYVKNGQFGLKGIGYTNTASGSSKIPEEAKGKYKSSGMTELKESLMREDKKPRGPKWKDTQWYADALSSDKEDIERIKKIYSSPKGYQYYSLLKKMISKLDTLPREDYIPNDVYNFLFSELEENLSFKSLFEKSLSFPDDWDSMEHPNYPEIQKGNKYGLFKTEENGSWNDGGGNIETGMVKSSDNIEDLIITAKEEYMNENNIEFDDIPLDKNGLPPGYHIDELNYDDVQQDKEANAWVDKQHGDLKEYAVPEQDFSGYKFILYSIEEDDTMQSGGGNLDYGYYEGGNSKEDLIITAKETYVADHNERAEEGEEIEFGDIPLKKDGLPMGYFIIDNPDYNPQAKKENDWEENKGLKEAWEGAEFDTGKFDDGPQPKIEVDNIDDKIEAIIHLAEKADNDGLLILVKLILGDDSLDYFDLEDNVIWNNTINEIRYTLNHRFSTAEVNDLYNNLEKEGLL